MGRLSLEKQILVRILLIATGVWATLFFNGCGQPGPLVTNLDKQAPILGLTYYKDIAPILSDRCVTCHTAGGIASAYSFDSFSNVHLMKDAIQSAVVSRRMPPWGPTDDGSCGEFDHSRYLSNQEIQFLDSWAKTGGAEGVAAPTPQPDAPRTLDNPTLFAKMPLVYQPVRGKADDYQCFVVPTTVIDSNFNMTPKLFVTGFQVTPGNKRVVHHVIALMTAPRDDIDAIIAAKENENPDMGWDCLGGIDLPGVAMTNLGAWVPGEGITIYPQGTGITFDRDKTRLIIQVHYSTAALGPNENALDQTSLTFKLADDQAGLKPGAWFTAGTSEINLPPGQPSVSLQVERSLAAFMKIPEVSIPAVVHGVFPHMHTRGTKINLTHTSSNTCMTDVPSWKFNWQGSYFFKTPMNINLLDTFRVKCTYSTATDTTPVTYGENTNDEMCGVAMFVTAP